MKVIETSKHIKGLLQESNDLFHDFLLPVADRRGLIKNKSNVIPVLFYRYIGLKGSRDDYQDLLVRIHNQFGALDNGYLCISSGLSGLVNEELFNKAKNQWDKVMKQSNKDFNELILSLYKVEAIIKTGSKLADDSIAMGYKDILKLFYMNEVHGTDTILKNFGLKMLTWINSYIPKLYTGFAERYPLDNKTHNPKIIFHGTIKKHEIYFLIMLSKIGCDVLYINSFSDEEFKLVDRGNKFSYPIHFSKREPLQEFSERRQSKELEVIKVASIGETEVVPIKMNPKHSKVEKGYEELAKLSCSIVMLKTFNQYGEFIGSGSGIIVDEHGLIATNYHVLKGGTYYEVVFEGLSEGIKYQTYTIVNTDIKRDLALINIPLTTKPVEVGLVDQVKRGQRVVAIGSPLGLMNTISDGIVSGFRNIGSNDFVQTTAPISPGSSGGALFNMYGELIGITSAGYIDGQNINLAIPTKDVLKLMKNPWTILNREIMRFHSKFNYKDNSFIFDGFFSHGSKQNYKVTLYQGERSILEFKNYFNDPNFRKEIENYYENRLKSIILKYEVQGYDFEIGGQRHIFTYHYDRGMVNKQWVKLGNE